MDTVVPYDNHTQNVLLVNHASCFSVKSKLLILLAAVVCNIESLSINLLSLDKSRSEEGSGRLDCRPTTVVESEGKEGLDSYN
jgi:hypothetical protein